MTTKKVGGNSIFDNIIPVKLFAYSLIWVVSLYPTVTTGSKVLNKHNNNMCYKFLFQRLTLFFKYLM